MGLGDKVCSARSKMSSAVLAVITDDSNEMHAT